MKKYQDLIRLPLHSLEAIGNTFKTFFLKEDSLFVFGSRVDMTKKGGDIDLYIETDFKEYAQAVDAKIAFLCKIKQRIGDQKIDVVLRLRSSDYDAPIFMVAREEGIQIV